MPFLVPSFLHIFASFSQFYGPFFSSPILEMKMAWNKKMQESKLASKFNFTIEKGLQFRFLNFVALSTYLTLPYWTCPSRPYMEVGTITFILYQLIWTAAPKILKLILQNPKYQQLEPFGHQLQNTEHKYDQKYKRHGDVQLQLGWKMNGAASTSSPPLSMQGFERKWWQVGTEAGVTCECI